MAATWDTLPEPITTSKKSKHHVNRHSRSRPCRAAPENRRSQGSHCGRPVERPHNLGPHRRGLGLRFGCLIRGGTPHFDYVCQSVTQGVTALNADCDTPVIFGVLTVDTEQDAIDRAGGPLGNKGAEAAEAAIMMVDFKNKVSNL